MWYAITYLRPLISYYRSVCVFVKSLRRGEIPVTVTTMKRPKKSREVVSVWRVMRLHGYMCREYIEPYVGRWMTEEEFRRVIEYVVEKCYRSTRARRKRMEMFERWIRSEPRFGEGDKSTQARDLIKLGRDEVYQLVGDRCIRAYVMPIYSVVMKRLQNYIVYSGKKSYAILSTGTLVVIDKKCAEAGVSGLPHIPRYGVIAIRFALGYIEWLRRKLVYIDRYNEYVDRYGDLLNLMQRLVRSRKQYKLDELDENTKTLVETVSKLYNEYLELVDEVRRRNIRAVLIEWPVANAIEDIANDAGDGKVWTNNVDDLRKKLEKYIEILRRAVELNKEKILIKMLLG
jgi:molybdopterin converting factor small subunit